jgi:hypothetical protein
MTNPAGLTSPASPTSPPPDFVIEAGDTFARVTPSCVDLLQPHLSFAAVEFERGGPTGHTCRRRRKNAYFTNEGESLDVPAGLVPRVREILVNAGRRVEVRNHRRLPERCEAVNNTWPDGLSADDEAVLAAVRSHLLGQLVVGNQKEVLRAVELICRLWPEAIILIPVATLDEMRALYEALRARLDGDVCMAHGRNWSRSSNRVICTYSSLESCDYDGVDVVIFTEPTTAYNLKVSRAVGGLEYPHLRYALRQECQRLDPAEELLLEGICGPTVYRSPTLPREPDPVQVILADAHLGYGRAGETAVERKRRHYWHNDARNRVIAEVATALAEGREADLWRHGLSLDPAQPLRSASSRPSVAVLVELPEHGRALQDLLPGWALLSTAPAGSGRATDSQAAAQARGWGGLPSRSIVTPGFAKALGSLDADVVVVASGGDCLTGLKGFPPRRQSGTPADRLVIDFGDDADEQAADETRSRLRCYRSQGWRITASQRWTDFSPDGGIHRGILRRNSPSRERR